MASPNQIAAQIRFQLEQLTARNAQHEFEHLCRYLARRRICSNILPATGPVGAGGDQGRDFETFRTYLADHTTGTSSLFLGLVSDKAVAFACTLTAARDLKSKIKTDVSTIVEGGPKVRDVHYFCSADLAVAKRHKLQDWASSEFNTHLEVYDGQAIAEFLAEPDLFWIATEYLSIPAEIYPVATGEEDWYDQLRQRWLGADRTPENFADFMEIKSALRHATFTDSVKPDLGAWLNLLEQLKLGTDWPGLRRKCRYEIFVANLRGLGALDGFNEEVTAYLSEATELSDPAELEDTAVYWTYCAGAQMRSLIPISRDSIETWRSSIISRVESELAAAESAGRRCLLLDTLGFLELSKDAGVPGGRPNCKAAVEIWLELVDEAADAPLYPLEKLADRLASLVTVCGGPSFDKLTGRTDELLAGRQGMFAAANKCHRRASALYHDGQLVRAVRELHQAKVQWFAREAIHQSIFSMLLLSSTYSELRLGFAAKYYALMAGYTALRTDRDDVKKLAPKALTTAAGCDYSLGAWCGFFDLERMALSLFAVFCREEDPTEMNEINTALFHASAMFYLSRQLDIESDEFLRVRVDNIGLSEELADLIDSVANPWAQRGSDAVWEMIEDQLTGRPFSDVGPERRASFCALGIRWNFRWKNDYGMSANAEEFLAVLQVLLADLAGIDLCILRTTVDVYLRESDNSLVRAEPAPSNDTTAWTVFLPCSLSAEKATLELSAEVLGVASSLLCSASLMPNDQIVEVLQERFRAGLTTKVFSVERYSRIYAEFVNREEFEKFDSRFGSEPQANREFQARTHPDLEWVAGPGPGYTRESSEEGVRRRYRKCLPPIRKTLERIRRTEHFQNLVRDLRNEGWLDWHILQATMNMVMNIRMQRSIRLGMSPEAAGQLADRWVDQEEQEENGPLPASAFTVENFKHSLRLSMLATVQNYGLEIPHETPDFDAIEDFLRERYRYWQDDAEHDDIVLGRSKGTCSS